MSKKSHEYRREIKATKPGAFHKRRPAGTKVLRASLMGSATGVNPPWSMGLTREEANAFIDKRLGRKP